MPHTRYRGPPMTLANMQPCTAMAIATWPPPG